MSATPQQHIDIEFTLNPNNDKLFTAVYKYYLPKLVRAYTKKYPSINRDVIRDICVDSIIHARDKAHQYDPKKSQFQTWLYTITYRRIVVYIKKNFYIKYSLDHEITDSVDTHWKDTLTNEPLTPEETEEGYSPQSLLDEIEQFVEDLNSKMSKIWLYHFRHNWDYKYTYAHFDNYTKNGIRASVKKVNDKILEIPRFKEILQSILEEEII